MWRWLKYFWLNCFFLSFFCTKFCNFRNYQKSGGFVLSFSKRMHGAPAEVGFYSFTLLILSIIGIKRLLRRFYDGRCRDTGRLFNVIWSILVPIKMPLQSGQFYILTGAVISIAVISRVLTSMLTTMLVTAMLPQEADMSGRWNARNIYNPSTDRIKYCVVHLASASCSLDSKEACVSFATVSFRNYIQMFQGVCFVCMII